MSKIFVIAGTVQQAEQWIKGNLEKRKNSGVTTLSWSDYLVVTSPDRIRGYNEPHGVFIGTWRNRKDMEDIFQALLTCHSIDQNSHRRINQLWGEWKSANPRPTPKLKKVSGGWINEELALDHAANLLAKSIDQHIIDSIKKATP